MGSLVGLDNLFREAFGNAMPRAPVSGDASGALLTGDALANAVEARNTSAKNEAVARVQKLEDKLQEAKKAVIDAGGELPGKDFKILAGKAFYNMKDQIQFTNLKENEVISIKHPLDELRKEINRLSSKNDDLLVTLKSVRKRLFDNEQAISKYELAIEESDEKSRVTDRRVPDEKNLNQMRSYAIENRFTLLREVETTEAERNSVKANLLANQKRVVELETGTGDTWNVHWYANNAAGDDLSRGEPENVFLYNLLAAYAPENVSQAKLSDTDYDNFKLKLRELRTSRERNIGDDVIMNLASLNSRETQSLMSIMAARDTVVRLINDKMVGGSGPLAIHMPGPPERPFPLKPAEDEEPQYKFNVETYGQVILATLGDTIHSTSVNVYSTIPKEFQANYKQLLLINKISRCGLNPRMWLRECGETISGMVSDILDAWESNSQRALTADELRGVFDSRYRSAPTMLDFNSAYHLRLRDDDQRVAGQESEMKQQVPVPSSVASEEEEEEEY